MLPWRLGSVLGKGNILVTWSCFLNVELRKLNTGQKLHSHSSVIYCDFITLSVHLCLWTHHTDRGLQLLTVLVPTFHTSCFFFLRVYSRQLLRSLDSNHWPCDWFLTVACLIFSPDWLEVNTHAHTHAHTLSFTLKWECLREQFTFPQLRREAKEYLVTCFSFFTSQEERRVLVTALNHWSDVKSSFSESDVFIAVRDPVSQKRVHAVHGVSGDMFASFSSISSITGKHFTFWKLTWCLWPLRGCRTSLFTWSCPPPHQVVCSWWHHHILSLEGKILYQCRGGTIGFLLSAHGGCCLGDQIYLQ